jgi:hypothetical protein
MSLLILLLDVIADITVGVIADIYCWMASLILWSDASNFCLKALMMALFCSMCTSKIPSGFDYWMQSKNKIANGVDKGVPIRCF